jgi:hypothetical protein
MASRKIAERGQRRTHVVERRSIAHEREHAVAQKANAAEREHYAHAKRRERVNPLCDQVPVSCEHDTLSPYR